MLKIGITGGIGTGKSTVCRIFEILGIPVFYADDESKKIIASDPAVIAAIKKELRDDLYTENIPDRKKIAALVFNDKEKQAALNAISHPALFQEFKSWVHDHTQAPYVIQEAALIFESGADAHLDQTIVVTSPISLRLERLTRRDSVTEETIKARMMNQWPEEEKIKRANFIIENNDETLLIPQVIEIHKSLLHESEMLHVF
jgi:dephospho-CoA kinase